MRKTIIIIIVIAVIALGIGLFLIFPRGNGMPSGDFSNSQNSAGLLPPIAPTSSVTATPQEDSSLPGYLGSASDIYGSLPTGTVLQIGTAQGTVSINNFYTTNPPVVEGGTIVIKQTPNYDITYDPSVSSFWLAITGQPFATWQVAAEQDFLATLGVSRADACKLSVTSGIIYSPGDPNDGKSFPLSFCQSDGAFQ